MKQPVSVFQTLDAIKATLEQMARWGAAGFACDSQTVDMVNRWSANIEGGQLQCDTLPGIQADLGDCQRCRLSRNRRNIVFGEGDPDARVVFVGEGPGFEEDRSGRPFVGPAGQLLTKIIAAMHLRREQVYICNVVKCRPPDNRNPKPDEIAACRPFLERQIAAIDPEVICTLGTFATQTLLDVSVPISRLRGQFQPFQGYRVMPTFHPAYILRNPERKRDVWEDVKKIMALLRIPV